MANRNDFNLLFNRALDYIIHEVAYLENGYKSECTVDEFCRRIRKKYRKDGHTSSFERRILETVLEETTFNPKNGILYVGRNVKIPSRDICIKKYKNKKWREMSDVK